MIKDYFTNKCIKAVKERVDDLLQSDEQSSNIREISEKEIIEIIEFRSAFIAKAFEQELEVKLDYFLSFIIKDGQRDALRNITRLRSEGKSDEEIEQELAKIRQVKYEEVITTYKQRREATKVKLGIKLNNGNRAS